jgi:hypothetical protein
MSFKKNESQQLSLADTYMSQSERTKRYLDKSWAAGFSSLLFPQINEDRFSVLYSKQKFSRPNTPVNVIIGALILKEMNQLTDDELLESLLFDVRYQYALHTTSFEEQPISDRTVSRFRARLLDYERETGIDLLKEEMLALADSFVKYSGIDTRKKRMDSLMVATNCRRMSRLDLIYTCIAKLIRQLSKEKTPQLIEGMEKYLDEDDFNNTIYRAKPNEIPERFAVAVADGHEMLRRLSDTHGAMEAYKILERCLSEQTKEVDGKHELRENKDVGASALQTPFDPDATYRLKAGKRYCGYVGNIVETVDGKNDMTVAFITDFDYQKNTYDDSQFCQNVLDKMGTQEQSVQLVSDGAFFSVKNVEAASERNIELITGAVTNDVPNPLFTEFEVDEETNLITKCPAGNIPMTSRFNNKDSKGGYNRCYRITFETSVCQNCPNKSICRVNFIKTKATVIIRENTIKRAQHVKKMSLGEYRKLIRFRAGIEGVPSVLRRKYKVDKIPDRGYLRSKLWYTVKIGAINAARMLAGSSNLTGLCDFRKFGCFMFFRQLFFERMLWNFAVLTP